MKLATVHLTHELAQTSADLPWAACGKVALDLAHTLDIQSITCKACLKSIAGKKLLGEPLKPVTVHLIHELAQTSDDLPWMACGKLVLDGSHTSDIRDVTCKACLKSVAGQKLWQDE
ncbi:hypothetical protein [Leptolyngbya sp. BL0902]|uniref:hypothetical protein n=1 Tax=Leptolyngbya sp. BL0902 TaxID=1115757 RepID=UPI0018E81269|nr:hypothetical protein [Leptolyngbya sp. BL0902]